MSLLDKASLIVTPNAYKESKLYSVIPTSGAGDMTVVRATTATRKNSAGLIEVVPRNLLTYSEQFDNADWNKISATITPNTTIAPNGTSTADTLVITSGGYLVRPISSYSAVTGQKITASIFTKNQTTNFLAFGGASPAGTDVYSIETISNGWYRHKVTRTFTTTVVGTVQFIIFNQIGTHFIWGAQLENFASATEYFPTTNRLNIPRIDYTNGSCPTLLVEPQRTNINLQSQNLTNAAYSVANGAGGSVTRTANYGISPDGTQNATRLQFVRGAIYAEFYQRAAVSIGSTYTLSFWAKSLSGTPTLYSTYNNGYANEITFTNQWVKYTYTFVAGSFGTSGLNLITWVGLPTTSLTADLLVWGVQLEVSAYPTSYIPTVATSVTRIADIISKTGISSLIGQTEGTLYGEIKLETANGGSAYFAITSGSFSNFILFGKESGVTPNKLCLGIRANGTNIIFNTSISLTSSFVKVAIAYKSGDWAIYLNGSLVFSGTNTFTFSSALNSFGFTTTGDFTSMNEKIEVKSGQIYKTRLSNTELAQLTTI